MDAETVVMPQLLTLDGDTVTVRWGGIHEFRLIWVIFGSADSTDVDVMFWIPIELTTANPHVYTMICYALDTLSKDHLAAYGVDVTRPINSCLGHWTEDGKLIWTMKGTVSEGNNSIVSTCHNHPQMTKQCEFVRILRTYNDVRLKVLGAMRMITSTMADASYDLPEKQSLDIHLKLLGKILEAPETSALSSPEKHNMRQILFQIPELKTFITKRCKFLPTAELCRMEELKKRLKVLAIDDLKDLHSFEIIYCEAKTITESLIAMVRADYNSMNTADLKPEHIGAMIGDFEGSIFTMHRISRLITRTRFAFLQTTFLENINCVGLIVAAPESLVEVWKKIAFQLGQTLALIGGEELFEKRHIAAKYPNLASFLLRKTPTERDHLGIMVLFKRFVHEIYDRRIIGRMDTELQYRQPNSDV